MIFSFHEPHESSEMSDDIMHMPLGASEETRANMLAIAHEEEASVIAWCNAFKQKATTYAQAKKQKLEVAYRHLQGVFDAQDALPVPFMTQPGIADARTQQRLDKQRPKTFFPLTKQVVHQLYAQLKLTFFPNDEDYFRVRGRDPEAALLEDDLTDALKQVFKENLLTEQLGAFLFDLCWAGMGFAIPAMETITQSEWYWDEVQATYQYRPVLQQRMTLHTLHPMSFFIDPQASLGRWHESAWCHVGKKKIRSILEEGCSQRHVQRFQALLYGTHTLEDTLRFSGLTHGYQLHTHLPSPGETGSFPEESSHAMTGGASGSLHEKALTYETFYFPYLELRHDTTQAVRVLRHVSVHVVEHQWVVGVYPNTSPRAENPAVFCHWHLTPEGPYGEGPAEAITELQRLVNILENYKLEAMARIGNRFVVPEGTDLSQFFGVAGGIMVTERPNDVQSFHGDFSEIATLMNQIGMLKAEAQITSGANHAFQGASQIDFKKTATEMQILQEQTINDLREVIEHIGIMGIKPLLERFMVLVAHHATEPMLIRQDSPTEGTVFKSLDLRVLLSGRFHIEVVSINVGQSKQKQLEWLTQLLTLTQKNPVWSQQLKQGGYPILKKMAMIAGMKDVDAFLTPPVASFEGGASGDTAPSMTVPPM
ncbi:MAG: hypothetical protein ACKO37_04660 [Vampirovibrionales bacterium]